jgi:hypothetical protein
VVQALRLPSLAALLLVAVKLVHDLRQLRRQEAAPASGQPTRLGGRG